MNMKDHILTALSEQLQNWELLLSGMSPEQVTAPLLPSEWCTKDVIAHLWAWQQRSIARVEAALEDREPRFPEWLPGVDADAEDSTEQINTWLYQTHRTRTWPQVHRNWRSGFLHLLEISLRVSEKDHLDGSRYTWLGGYPLAYILLATYDHHQEHLEKLLAWLKENRPIPPAD